MQYLRSIFYILCFGLTACGHAADVGLDSELRFHIRFNNHIHNDLDLHVVEPSGKHLGFKKSINDSQAQLSLDCRCGDCSNGPEEFIYWDKKQAGTGLYEIWIEDSGGCEISTRESEFTLEVYQADQLKATLQGLLRNGQSHRLYYVFTR